MHDHKGEENKGRKIANYLAVLAFKREAVLTPKRDETLIKKSGNQKMAAAGARLSQGAMEMSPPRLIDECLATRSTW